MINPNRKYRLTKASEIDLDSIWEYTFQQWGVEQANRYLILIDDCLTKLCDTPYIGVVEDRLQDGVRSLPSGQHQIFYRVYETEIHVLRILHQSMNTLDIVIATDELFDWTLNKRR